MGVLLVFKTIFVARCTFAAAVGAGVDLTAVICKLVLC